ncbi:MAG TPA: hypothetical protein VN207_13595, partial [Ktedonobacteraceae bacterium]|nr:hypothetical protein [Ktedonobacteraceae bacterium]
MSEKIGQLKIGEYILKGKISCMIAIIDYGAGNIRSIEKALEQVGAQVQVTDDPALVANARAVVLPGVGSAGAAMARMTERGLDDAIRGATQQG